MAFNPSAISRVCVRATNWLGDAVMSLPAIRAIRQVFPHAHVAVVARPWVADLYARESSIDRVIPYTAQKGLGAKRAFAATLRRERFDAAILLQNAFDAALLAWLAGIPERIGYNRDARGLLLTRAIRVPEPGDIPRHERFALGLVSALTSYEPTCAGQSTFRKHHQQRSLRASLLSNDSIALCIGRHRMLVLLSAPRVRTSR